MDRRSETVTASRYDIQDLADAVSHPVKGRVMAALYERPGATIRQVAKRLKEPPRRIRHQIDALVATGLVEVAGEELRRGVIERRYRMLGPIELEDQDGLSEDQRARLTAAVVKLLLADVAEAARAGTLGKRPDRCEARSYGEVDEACAKELAEIHLRAYREIKVTLDAGRTRVRESGRPGTEVISALFFFEAPLWGSTTEAPVEDPD